MHSYIGKTEIMELVQNNRKGIIIENIITYDIDEYINNVLIVLRNMGINTNVFTQPKIKKINIKKDIEHKYKYIILLVIRKDAKLDDKAYENIKNCIKNIAPCNTIQDWIKNKYVR